MDSAERKVWAQCAVFLRAEATRYGDMPAHALRMAARTCEREAATADTGIRELVRRIAEGFVPTREYWRGLAGHRAERRTE